MTSLTHSLTYFLNNCVHVYMYMECTILTQYSYSYHSLSSLPSLLLPSYVMFSSLISPSILPSSPLSFSLTFSLD